MASHLITLAARLSGISPNALRRYESLGLIQPGRNCWGWREYTDDEIREIREIASTRKPGRPKRRRADQGMRDTLAGRT